MEYDRFSYCFLFITVIILCGIAFLYKKKREVLIFKFKEKKGETGEIKWIVYDDYFQVKYIQNDMLHEYKVDDIKRIRKMGNYYVVYLHKKKFYVDTDEMGAEQAAFIEWIKNTDRLV